MKLITKVFALLSIILLVAACQGPKSVPPVNSNSGNVDNDLTILFSGTSLEASDMQSFESETELKQFVKEYSNGGGMYYGRGLMMDMAVDSIAMESAPVAFDGASTKMAVSQNDFSETNVQHLGIDEADILKTDGEYIYTVTGNTLFIIKAYPGEDAEVVQTINFDNQPEGLFLEDNVLAVMGTYNNVKGLETYKISSRQGMSYLNFYDVSDKKNPELVDEFVLTGRYDDARLHKGKMYLMTKSWMNRYSDPVPFLIDNGVRESLPIKDVFFRPMPYDSPVFYRAYSFDMSEHNKMIDFVSVATEGNSEIYVSENGIYLGTQKYINEYEFRQELMFKLLEPRLTSDDKKLVDKIMSTDNDILSRREKMNKIQEIYSYYSEYMSEDERNDMEDELDVLLKEKMDEFEYMQYTVIDKINLDNGKLNIAANGRVPGRVNNQFSFDEYNDVLRVATTIPAKWSSFSKERTESTNAVFTLNSDLEIIGELKDLAEGESVFSTRFMGERLYMVTFRQVDPFFVIDLSNPKNPKELGKLKIPGFSRYLHPYDKNTIIGIGQDADEETGRTRGLKISLFDVTDVSNPKEVSKYTSESRYAQSSAMYEHKAFLFSKEKNLLVIPVSNYNYRESDESYNGAFVFDISKDDINLRGLIDHSEGAQRYYGTLVERSLYINELLYTKSPNLLRINELDDLSSVAKLKLDGSKGQVDDIIIY